MFELIQKFFIGHVHQWEIIEEIKVKEFESDWLPLYKKYVCRCKFCGSIKVFRS